MTASNDRRNALRAAILEIARARGTEKTLCPSEAARAVVVETDDWRALMPETRTAALSLAAEGAIEITQKGRPVDGTTARGPIRLRLLS